LRTLALSHSLCARRRGQCRFFLALRRRGGGDAALFFLRSRDKTLPLLILRRDATTFLGFGFESRCFQASALCFFSLGS
jgi:hypothetical protein